MVVFDRLEFDQSNGNFSHDKVQRFEDAKLGRFTVKNDVLMTVMPGGHKMKAIELCRFQKFVIEQKTDSYQACTVEVWKTLMFNDNGSWQKIEKYIRS